MKKVFIVLEQELYKNWDDYGNDEWQSVISKIFDSEEKAKQYIIDITETTISIDNILKNDPIVRYEDHTYRESYYYEIWDVK